MNESLEIDIDGRVRITINHLFEIRTEHLLSRLDDHVSKIKKSESCELTGYTEWISQNHPVITLGWDIRIDTFSKHVSWVRVGYPRSNICLIDQQGQRYPWKKNLLVLKTVVDSLNWHSLVAQEIKQQYG